MFTFIYIYLFYINYIFKILKIINIFITLVDFNYSNYIAVGDIQGIVRLYNHEERSLMISRSTPPLPDFRPILEKQTIDGNIIYVTCPQSNESSKAVTALKFSPKCR